MERNESTSSIRDASAPEAATAEEDSSPSITSPKTVALTPSQPTSESPEREHEYEQICYEKL